MLILPAGERLALLDLDRELYCAQLSATAARSPAPITSLALLQIVTSRDAWQSGGWCLASHRDRNPCARSSSRSKSRSVSLSPAERMSKPQGYVGGCSPEHALLIIGRPKLRASRFRACATRPARRRAAAPLRHRATALASVRCAASIDAQRFVCQLSGGWRCELHGGRLGGSRQDMMSRSAPRRPQQPLSAREGLGRTASTARAYFLPLRDSLPHFGVGGWKRGHSTKPSP